MDEEIKKEEENKESDASKLSAKDRDKQEKHDLIDRANTAREGLEKENTRIEKNIQDLKETEAKRILGGDTDAGVPEKKKEEQSPVEYAKQVLEGKFNE